MTLIASDKRITIVGLGATGLSCARFLRRRGQPFRVIDSRLEPPMLAQFRAEFSDVPLHLGSFDTDLMCAASELVVSPGVALAEPAIAAAQRAGVSVIGDIDLFVREAAAPIVAVTGSNGKSTVTTLVGEMAQAAGRRVAVGGNLGTPALDLLADDIELYVLELSSFQLERAAPLNAAVATVLNVSPDHMDRYATVLAYHQAKHRIYRGARHCVFNRDDSLSEPLLARDVKATSFGLDRPDLNAFGVITDGNARWLAFGAEQLLRCDELKMAGEHNVANALAALALGQAAGLPMPPMLTVLRSFTGLAHRCQHVADIDGVHFYDDSKGTNVGATVAAVTGLAAGRDRRIVLIAGGVGKDAEFEPLAPVLKQYGRAVVLIGDAAPALHAVLAAALPCRHASSMEEAVALAAELAEPDDCVLLSPACASFDMFRDYNERGDVFTAAVLARRAAAC